MTWIDVAFWQGLVQDVVTLLVAVWYLARRMQRRHQ